MSAPLAMIPYANMAPYRQLGVPQGCHFVPLVPSASVGALLAGTVNAAAVPVGGLPRLGKSVEMVGRFGIAAKGPCMSVMLFSRVPFEAIQSPRTLRITSETASSVRLLYLLLGQTLGFDRLPRLAADGETADAELLIGDRALIRGVKTKADDAFPYVIDLAQKWYERHGLPFVFARWVVRTEAPEPVKMAIARWLERFRENESRFVDQAVPPTARDLDLPHDVVRRYFQVIRRCLDDTDMQGQQRFLQDLEAVAGQMPFQKNVQP